jgi:hypothetical protein
MVRVLWKLTQALPIRLVAVYVVFHDPLWISVVDTCTQLCPTSVRLRTRSIQGKDEKFATWDGIGIFDRSKQISMVALPSQDLTRNASTAWAVSGFHY